jgi:peptide/nickel transport system substrate-binding protein
VVVAVHHTERARVDVALDGPDGYGPWQVSSYYPGNELVLTQNPGWTRPRGNISTVIVKQIADPAQQSELLAAGSAQYSGQLTWSEYKSLQKSSSVRVYPCASFSRDTLVLQEADPRFAKAQVRQAIAMAIDRPALVVGAYAGFGESALTGWLPSSLPAGVAVAPTPRTLGVSIVPGCYCLCVPCRSLSLFW